MTIRIRPGQEADIPVLQALERDAAQAFASVGYDFCVNGPVRTVQEHQRGIAHGAILVAELDERPAGFVLLWPVDGRAHITEVSVASSFQRRGIGKALIAAAEVWAKEAGFSEVTLTTFRDVIWNAPYYSSLGYEAFTPHSDQIELQAVQAEEAASGYHAAPRIAMKKPI